MNVQTLPRVHWENVDCLASETGDIRKLPEESHLSVPRGQQLSDSVQFDVHYKRIVSARMIVITSGTCIMNSAEIMANFMRNNSPSARLIEH